ncbi:MAG: transcriptional regulator, Crp/Fnr family [Betaproteobacteria bacterium]|jgi:CRP/FNR family transcriptional regulator, cyclic AMP receptor protein|nr:transcriptional regulator, Crp/Fnr family [Betaproteobacteria bacterium]MEA3155707.1 family transcriptional regulator, cyclic receptor protein [Betaproteobacteria bacterium]
MASLAVGTTMLRTLPLLSRLSDRELVELIPRIQHRSYPRHTLMLRAGEKSDALYIIVSGKAKILVDDGDGREVTFTSIGSGELFGEMSFADEKPRSASVQALEPCEVLYIPRSALLECLKHNFDAAMYVLKIAVARLRQADLKIASLALMDVRGRVARLLIDLAHDVNGVCIVDTGAEEIARMVGASREMVSRVVKEMAERGLVKRHKRKIIVLDRASLPQLGIVH